MYLKLYFIHGPPVFDILGLKYCDSVGLARCKQGFRRVVTYRTSVDGWTWSDDAACPGQPWDPEYAQQPWSSQFHFCNAGWNADGMITPSPGVPSTVNEAQTADPPEMQVRGRPPQYKGVLEYLSRYGIR